jgi:hypothetical protein
LIARYRSRWIALGSRLRLAASMQMGVEIHLHQGKPEARAANTHCVGQALWLITHEASF